MRVSKKPEERKQEIVEAALDLFLEKGYENVSIKDITEKINVAAGLFHYYFHSKEEVFMESVKLDRQKYINEILKKNFYPSDISVIQKINRLLLDILQNLTARNRLLQEARSLNSEMLFHQVRDHVIGETSDKFADLIREGNEEGVFHCEYPNAAAEIMLFGMSHYFDREQERDPNLHEVTMGEYMYTHRAMVRKLAMGILKMKEPHGLLCYDGDEESDQNSADPKG